ncbi:MAG TPA: hypothetical protein VGL86_01055 [Polyangia bacterium]|jgi:hypothetical protein
MSVRQWLLASALVAAGCATSGVSDRDMAQLPVAEREHIMTAHKSVDVAASNMEVAKVARDEAKQFRRLSARELDAAKLRLQAAQSGVDLASDSRDDRALRAAGHVEDDARIQLVAARAKLDYADRLVELREAKISEAEAAFAAARTDVELTKVRIAQRNGLARDIDERAYEARRQDAAERLAEERAKVADAEGETAQLKVAWDDRRHETSRTASRTDFVAPPAPPAAAPLPQPKWRNDSRGDVNDTPGAPEKEQAQQPRNNIAPPP